MGAQMVKEVAEKTSMWPEDGTTTATVLPSIYREGLRNVTWPYQSDGAQARHREGGRIVVQELKKLSTSD